MAEKGLPPPGAEPADPAPAPAPTVWKMVRMLAFGLLPLLGIALCVMWGYGSGVPAWKRTLALAVLVLHGAAMALLLLALGAWVVWLAVTTGFI